LSRLNTNGYDVPAKLCVTIMTKNNQLLLVCLVMLASIYAIWFTDWFRSDSVIIFHTSRYQQIRSQLGGASPSLMFILNRQLKLTEIKVVPLAALQTNPAVLPLWHLVSGSNSVPKKSFFYGQPIRGLKPAVPGSLPQPLETNVTYRLFVMAGKIRAEHDFELK